MTGQLPSLDGFAPEAFDTDTKSGFRLKFQLIKVLREWFDVHGMAPTIDRLNHLGHTLRPHESENGWTTYRGAISQGKRHFEVSMEHATGEVLVTSPLTDEAWEQEVAGRKEAMSPEELRNAALREQFQRRASVLFSKHYNEWKSLSEPDRAIMSIYVLEAEINNGGLSQYYINTGGHQAKAVVAYLQMVGAHRAAEIVQESVRLLGPTLQRELTKSQWDALDQHARSLSELDSRFYQLDEDLARLTIRWLEAAKDG